MFNLTPLTTSARPSHAHTWLVVARVLLSLVFIDSGFDKLMGFSSFSAYLADSGVPASQLMTATAIALELGAGACLAIGYRTRWAAWALAAFTVVATCVGHPFWDGGPAAEQHLLHAMKNAAIVGGLLAIGFARAP